MITDDLSQDANALVPRGEGAALGIRLEWAPGMESFGASPPRLVRARPSRQRLPLTSPGASTVRRASQEAELEIVEGDEHEEEQGEEAASPPRVGGVTTRALQPVRVEGRRGRASRALELRPGVCEPCEQCGDWCQGLCLVLPVEQVGRAGR